MNKEIAVAAVEEARLLATSEGDLNAIADALSLALKALRGEEITDSELDDLHPAVAHRLRDQGQP